MACIMFINFLFFVYLPNLYQGSYATAGYLVSTLENDSPSSNYARFLDLDKGVAKALWTENGDSFSRWVTK